MAKKPSKKKKRTPPKLRVAFDTNILFTRVAHNLLQEAARQFIRDNSAHVDLRIEWYLSDIVVGERQYQMRQKADQLYTGIDQLEKLLGHQLTTREIVSDRIQGAIDDQMSVLGIQRLVLTPEDVDWADIIRRSVDRLPPFDPKVKEKGFRDAIIAEAFLQLVSGSPTTAESCRLAFVSDDELLRQYVVERTQDRQNVRILKDLSELESLINTLVSKVPENKIREWQEKASKYFFEKDDESSFFNKEKIQKKLAVTFSSELAATPEGNYSRENDHWYIADPIFIRKEGRRLHWMTDIQADSKLWRVPEPEPQQGALYGLGLLESKSTARRGLLTNLNREMAGTANTFMEVYWSVSISEQRETLSNGRVDDMKFVNTEFNVIPSTHNKLAELLLRLDKKE